MPVPPAMPLDSTNESAPYRPIVSVVVPTRNSERTIVRCLEGILDQSYRPVECTVIDGGSTDRTIELARSAGRDVKVIGTDLRRTSARRLGASESHGKYVLFLDSDQIPSRRLIEDCVEISERTGCSAVKIPETFESTGPWGRCLELDRQLISHDSLAYPRFFSLSTYREMGGHFSAIEDYMEDRALFLRIQSWKKTIRWTSQPLLNVVGSVNPVALGQKGVRAANDAESYYRETAALGESISKMVGLRARAMLENARSLGGSLSVLPLMPIYLVCAYGPRFAMAAIASRMRTRA